MRHLLRVAYLIALQGLVSSAAAQSVVNVGPNVNMVAGTHWPDGDPFLQRQNEPSIAVSSRNAQHLLAGANDYRTVDLNLVLNPNDDEVVIGDAWLGVFKSFDGGQTWRSNLLPGCPYNIPQCQGSVVSPAKYQAGADPSVRAGANGMFFYSSLAFDRDGKRSAFFVSRFIDDNNRERVQDDTIRFLDASVVDDGNSGRFTDKPWIAVDIPRAGAATCMIPASADVPAQNFPAGNVYVAYAKFTGQDERAKIYFSRSTNCGQSWSSPIKLSEGTAIAQGASIAIDPASGAVYVAWRRFKDTTDQPDAILVAKSMDGGQRFAKVATVSNIIPFDAGTTNYSFRSETFPSIGVDASGRVYVAYSARQTLFGDARVMLSTSTDGTTWTAPIVVDPPSLLYGMSYANPQLIQPGRGHQLMPSISIMAGKVAILYYSLYEDSTVGELQLVCPPGDGLCLLTHDITHFFEVRKATGTLLPLPANSGQLGTVFGPYVQDLTPPSSPPLTRRHTLDVRVATANAGASPVFTSTRVSQYPYGNPKTPFDFSAKTIQQLRQNPPNLPLFALGTKPFIGDYIDLNTQAIIPGATPGTWAYNLNGPSQVLQAVWTDNRDIRPPADGDWTHYTPTVTLNNDPYPSCMVGQAGMRNQNIYFARITNGLTVSAPGDSKQLSAAFQRGFSVIVQNNTDQTRTYRLMIGNQPAGGQASFLQTSFLNTLDVSAAPRSSFSRTVFITSTNPHAQVTVNVAEITAPGGSVVSGGQQSLVTLNPDLTNPDLTNPDLTNGNIQTAELYVPDLTNPDLTNPDLTNPDLTNPDLTNRAKTPDLTNPDLTNPDLTNPDLTNPDLTNTGTATPDLTNPDLTNPDLTNPDLTNADLAIRSLTDVTWTVRNRGNTTATFAVRLVTPRGKDSVPEGFKTQLILHKTYTTQILPTDPLATCHLIDLNQSILVANIVNPTFFSPVSPDLTNPDLTNPDLTNATIALAPGEQGLVTLRVHAPATYANPKAAVVDFINNTVQPAVISQGSNTGTAATPAPKSAVAITTLSAPNGQISSPYSLQLQAIGGIPAYTWCVATGSPAVCVASQTVAPGLTLNSLGLISGTPTTLGLFSFRVKVVDTGSAVPPVQPVQDDFQDLTITVTDQPTFLIAQTAAPAGSVGTLYTFTPIVLSGTAPILWTFYGNLPPGLTPNPSTGVITGTPLAAGTFNGYFVAKDATNQYAQLGVSITITGSVVTLTVTSTANTGAGSLRQAMTAANAVPIAQGVSIVFNIPGPAPYTIMPTTPLPLMSRPVLIDATTQPGYVGQPVVRLDGSLAGIGANGFTLGGGSSLIRGFAIGGFDGSGILLQSGGNNRITRNYIGTNLAGTAPYGVSPWNIGKDGIRIQDSPNNIIGGTAGTSPGGSCTGDCNVIVSRGNGWSGVNIVGALSVGNTLLGNFIGVDTTGTVGLGNTNSFGINATVGTAIIGDGSAAGRNIVAGFNTGIALSGSFGSIKGNYVGTNSAGTAAVVNNFGGFNNLNFGISIISGDHIAVENNVISGNGTGVQLSGNLSANNIVRGNLIGLNAAGTSAIPNTSWGIDLFNSANNNTIGGTTPAERNVISGNGSHGIALLNDASVTGNRIIGNYIGTNPAGSLAIPNGTDGINLDSVTNNSIGGIQPEQRNLISGNAFNGITITGTAATGNQILGNYIGTTAGGLTALHNAHDGVSMIDAPGNTVGGNTAGARNIISGNFFDGVRVSGASASNNAILGNYIGLGADGTSPVGNSGRGVAFEVASGTQANNVIGNNVVSKNNYGIVIQRSTNLTIAGNFVGTDFMGVGAMGNANGGISMMNISNSFIGGTTASTRNIVSGNAGVGILIQGTVLATNNQILGNYVGTASDGVASIANTGHGIFLQGGVIQNISIGGTNAGERNVIAFNAGAGVALEGAGTTGVQIGDNMIFGNGGLGIDLGADGVTGNDSPLDADDGPNHLQNYPIINTATSSVVSGSLNSSAGTFTIRLFKNDVCDPSGNGEGRILIDSFAVITASGIADFQRTGLSLNGGEFVTATATDGGGNTSEFSPCATVSQTIPVTVVSNSGAGSLRQAILDANATTGATPTIIFNLIGGAPYTITPLSALPTVTRPVVIDGTTQAGYSGHPIIMISGTSAGSASDGLKLTGGSSTVRGLAIGGFNSTGILLQNADGNLVTGNYLGTNLTGTAAFGNSLGLQIISSSNNTISLNLISGNTDTGMSVALTSTGNHIVSNLIGLDASGTVALGNNNIGVVLIASGNTLGGLTFAERNVISGNARYGIDIAGAATFGNVIRGNFVGTDGTGTFAIGNGCAGILVAAMNNEIGGAVSGAGNVISGNHSGLSCGEDDGIELGPSSTGNSVQGNIIGLDVTGTSAVPNTGIGIHLMGTGDTIGGLATAARNIISGNGQYGVLITGGSNSITGNYIGLNQAGDGVVPNVQGGIGATGANNTIDGNVVSGNSGFAGIQLNLGGGNILTGNRIGTDPTGSVAMPNTGPGVSVLSSNNAIGGVTLADGNTIALNGGQGVCISSGTGNLVLFNSIYANGGLGIDLGCDGATANDPGDGDTGANNLQNFPVIVTATPLSISGTLNSTASTNFIIQLFKCDSAVSGQGKTVLASFSLATDGSGNASFSQSVSVAFGASVTATATDPNGNTSEFVPCMPVL
jgi:parallel beta-helix repeat protein